jgi:enterochelin esterase family protein
MEYGADSTRQSDIPRGVVTKHEWKSQIFAETRRDYWIYVPAQYDGQTPAGIMVFQDGHAYVDEEGPFRVPIVFDNLIHKKTIPVLIGLFINPGHNGATQPASPWQSDNRSYEYDSLSDEYAQFLIEEMIPEVGKKYLLADDPKMRAICGISSGGICSFTAAWQRPDYFHKVLSHVGSFTDIRGGHVYPTLIRKSSKRDIRVFLQAGSNDLDLKFGNWWLSNLQMESALKFRDYDHKFAGGTGGHNGEHGGAILPESLEWLWREETPAN